MPVRVKMLPGLFQDITGAVGDVVFRHMKDGTVEACNRPRFRNPRETEENKRYREAYAYCDDRWRKLVWWKRRRWFKGAWPKGYCPHSAFMCFNMRRYLSGLPIIEVPGDKRAIPKIWEKPEAVRKNNWGHWRHHDDFDWVKGAAGEGFEVGDPRGAYKMYFQEWNLVAPIYGDRDPEEPPEMMTSRVFFRTNEGFILNQEGEDGLWINFAVEGMSIMLDGWLIAYCGDSVEGFECVQPCGPIDVLKQSWHDIIISQMVWDKTEFTGVAHWDGMFFNDFMDEKKVAWWGYVKGKGAGLRADWPNDAEEAEYEEIVGKTIYSAAVGWAIGARALGALPGPNEGDDVPLAKIEDSDDVRFGFTVGVEEKCEIDMFWKRCYDPFPLGEYVLPVPFNLWWKVKESDDERVGHRCTYPYKELRPGMWWRFYVPEPENLIDLGVRHEGFGLGGVGDDENLLEGYVFDFQERQWVHLFHHRAGVDKVTWSLLPIPVQRCILGHTLQIVVVGPPAGGDAERWVYTDLIEAVGFYPWHD